MFLVCIRRRVCYLTKNIPWENDRKFVKLALHVGIFCVKKKQSYSKISEFFSRTKYSRLAFHLKSIG